MRQLIPLLVAFCQISLALSLHAQDIPEAKVPRLPQAEELPNVDFDLTKIVQRLEELFTNCKSLQYVSERNSEDSPSYARLAWKETGEAFSFDFLSRDNIAKEELHKLVSFDGKRNFSLILPGSQVLLRDGRPELEVLNSFDSPLLLYSFLRTSAEPFTLSSLQPESSEWANLASRMKFLGKKTFDDKEVLAIRFTKGYNKDVKQLADYDVYFDPKTLLPIAWEAYDTEGFLIEQFRMLETGTIESDKKSLFVYPIRFSITQFQWLAKISGPNGPVRFFKNTRERKLSDVKIESLSPEDLQFDLTQGDSIYDENADFLIAIPK
jgi:hypothetical protein